MKIGRADSGGADSRRCGQRSAWQHVRHHVMCVVERRVPGVDHATGVCYDAFTNASARLYFVSKSAVKSTQARYGRRSPGESVIRNRRRARSDERGLTEGGPGVDFFFYAPIERSRRAV